MTNSPGPTYDHDKDVRRVAALIRRALMDKSYSVSGVNEKGGRLRGGSFKITEKRGNGYVLANFAESTTMMRDLSVELYTSREDKRPLRGPAAEIEIPRSRSGSNVDMDEKELLATAIASFAHNYLSTEAE